MKKLLIVAVLMFTAMSFTGTKNLNDKVATGDAELPTEDCIILINEALDENGIWDEITYDGYLYLIEWCEAQ